MHRLVTYWEKAVIMTIATASASAVWFVQWTRWTTYQQSAAWLCSNVKQKWNGAYADCCVFQHHSTEPCCSGSVSNASK